MTIKEFEMSQEQMDRLMECSKPVPLIAIHCGMPPSPQANANTAWAALGKEMGFESMTARPIKGKDTKCFTAEAIADE